MKKNTTINECPTELAGVIAQIEEILDGTSTPNRAGWQDILGDLQRMRDRHWPTLTITPGVYRLDVYRGDEDRPERGGRFRVLPDGTTEFDEDGYWAAYLHAAGAAVWDEPACWDEMTDFTAIGRTAEDIGRMLAEDACNLDRGEPSHRPFHHSRDRVVVSYISGLET
jgi:hypothetical protein